MTLGEEVLALDKSAQACLRGTCLNSYKCVNTLRMYPSSKKMSHFSVKFLNYMTVNYVSLYSQGAGDDSQNSEAQPFNTSLI